MINNRTPASRLSDFVYHSYDYRPNWTPLSPIIIINRYIDSVVRADINARDNFKWTPLHHACHSGQEDLVQLLLENGAEMDAQTINGGTPLMRAIESSREAVVELLISKGCVW